MENLQTQMQAITVEQTKLMFQYVGKQMINAKPLLTEIDSAIGDGDHGIGMETGFKKALENLEIKDPATINDVFKTIGMSMISSMGGASGVIFGTMFVGGLKNLEPTENLSTKVLAGLMADALQGVKTRGKAEIGDKTMIDALQPAVEALKQNEDAPLLKGLQKAEEKALEGVEKTKEYQANFGRAKSLGERAVGHQDAGATSVWIIFRSMREWMELEA
ncbi:dihydroxyacetone kinase subunit DhaL [Shouchella tritolerans]|uniref:dihydroxyacetone kinase subunit DhaL n=1 Tax=Shouchella tritolerans TaxID=2979466 RepID=UPI00384D0F2E